MGTLGWWQMSRLRKAGLGIGSLAAKAFGKAILQSGKQMVDMDGGERQNLQPGARQMEPADHSWNPRGHGL